MGWGSKEGKGARRGRARIIKARTHLVLLVLAAVPPVARELPAVQLDDVVGVAEPELGDEPCGV